MERLIQEAAIAVKNADVIFISAGAGMGVDSGLPDFRGDEGFWKAYPLLKDERLSFQDLANPHWFEIAPSRAWGFYGHRYNLYKKTKPHQGFKILQKWCGSKTEPPFIFTSNVDGHFEKSGFSSESIYECHGSINHLQCQYSCKYEVWSTKELKLSIDEDSLIAVGELPKCPYCSEIARPNILMFGDIEWISKRSTAQHHRFEDWQSKYQTANIVTIETGAGKEIPTARYASDSMPGTTVRINPRDADGNDNTISIALGALEALNKINDHLQHLTGD